MEQVASGQGAEATKGAGALPWHLPPAPRRARGSGLRCLPLRVVHHRYEPGYSLLSRLAMRHRCQTVGEFVSHLPDEQRGLQADVLAGRSMDALASLSGARQDNLVSYTPAHVSVRADCEVNGHAIGNMHCTLRRGAFCPVCTRLDLESGEGSPDARPWRRFWWGTGLLNTCPEHRVVLEFKCRGCGARADPMRQPELCDCGAPKGSLPQACPAEDTDSDSYILQRLLWKRTQTCAILDGVGVLDAYVMMLSIGSLVGRDREPVRGLRKLSPADRARVSSTGLRIFQDWPHGLHQVLAQLPKTRARGS